MFEQMVVDELIHEDDKPTIMRALLLRHRHVNEHSHGGFHFGPKRKYSSYSSLQVSVSCLFQPLPNINANHKYPSTIQLYISIGNQSSSRQSNHSKHTHTHILQSFLHCSESFYSEEYIFIHTAPFLSTFIGYIKIDISSAVHCLCNECSMQFNCTVTWIIFYLYCIIYPYPRISRLTFEKRRLKFTNELIPYQILRNNVSSN